MSEQWTTGFCLLFVGFYFILIINAILRLNVFVIFLEVWSLYFIRWWMSSYILIVSGHLKSPWSRKRRKHALTPQQWRNSFAPDGKLHDGGMKLLKKVRSGVSLCICGFIYFLAPNMTFKIIMLISPFFHVHIKHYLVKWLHLIFRNWETLYFLWAAFIF